MKISIIIPAFNEEEYLPATLAAIETASARLLSRESVEVETIVVDNNSVDGTADVARAKGAKVVDEGVQGISRARNTGARDANGDVLVFADADVLMPKSMLLEICSVMSDADCVGGGADVEYRPKRRSMRIYLGIWRILGRLTDMVQGSTQFCRKEMFEEVGGYDEKAWIGEDVDFYWALKKYAKRNGGFAHVIREPRVQPSSRRFDKWPLWRTLIWTNPLFIAVFRRWKTVWGGWYSDAVR